MPYKIEGSESLCSENGFGVLVQYIAECDNSEDDSYSYYKTRLVYVEVIIDGVGHVNILPNLNAKQVQSVVDKLEYKNWTKAEQ